MAPQGYKSCTKCGEVKPLDEFYRRQESRDGRTSACKECNCAKTRAWRRADPERARTAYKRWRKTADPELREAQRKRQRKRHPEKARARRILNLAVHRDTVNKPEACEGCGKELPKRLIHGHHPDYSKPLDVEWLCRGCHHILHLTTS